MAAPESKSGLERVYHFSFDGTIATGVTTEQPLFVNDRDIRFRQVGLMALQTITSGHPLTNYFRAELWNMTDGTKVAQATITGPSSGTLLERLSFVPIATKAQFIGPGSNASANKSWIMKFVGAATLNRGIVKPAIKIITDIID